MSLLITHEYHVDFAKPRTESCIEIMQGDDMSRCIRINLFCDGSAWNIPKEVAVNICWSRADGESGSYPLEGSMEHPVMEGNRILVTLRGEVTAVPGVAYVAVNLAMGQMKLNTWSAQIKVLPTPNYTA
jgi:hypothetical protein